MVTSSIIYYPSAAESAIKTHSVLSDKFTHGSWLNFGFHTKYNHYERFRSQLALAHGCASRQLHSCHTRCHPLQPPKAQVRLSVLLWARRFGSSSCLKEPNHLTGE